jgi:hypothetical protein
VVAAALLVLLRLLLLWCLLSLLLDSHQIKSSCLWHWYAYVDTGRVAGASKCGSDGDVGNACNVFFAAFSPIIEFIIIFLAGTSCLEIYSRSFSPNLVQSFFVAAVVCSLDNQVGLQPVHGLILQSFKGLIFESVFVLTCASSGPACRCSSSCWPTCSRCRPPRWCTSRVCSRRISFPRASSGTVSPSVPVSSILLSNSHVIWLCCV